MQLCAIRRGAVTACRTGTDRNRKHTTVQCKRPYLFSELLVDDECFVEFKVVEITEALKGWLPIRLYVLPRRTVGTKLNC